MVFRVKAEGSIYFDASNAAKNVSVENCPLSPEEKNVRKEIEIPVATEEKEIEPRATSEG